MQLAVSQQVGLILSPAILLDVVAMIPHSLVAPIQCLPRIGTVTPISCVNGARKECCELLCQKRPGFSYSLVLCYFRRSGGSVCRRVLRCDFGRLVAFMFARMLGVCARACMLSPLFLSSVCLGRSVPFLRCCVLVLPACLLPSPPLVFVLCCCVVC